MCTSDSAWRLAPACGLDPERRRADRPAALVERRPGEAGDHRLRLRCDARRLSRLRAATGADRHVRQDGTLWIEQPIYVQFAFALDRVKALAPQHPEWKDKQPFKAVLDGDMAALAAAGEHGAVEIVAATHAGMTPEEFRQAVKEWLATAKHPRFGRRYDELVYQPMLEVLTTCARMGSRPSSCRAGEPSSSGPSPRSATAFRRSRSSAPASPRIRAPRRHADPVPPAEGRLRG